MSFDDALSELTGLESSLRSAQVALLEEEAREAFLVEQLAQIKIDEETNRRNLAQLEKEVHNVSREIQQAKSVTISSLEAKRSIELLIPSLSATLMAERSKLRNQKHAFESSIKEIKDKFQNDMNKCKNLPGFHRWSERSKDREERLRLINAKKVEVEKLTHGLEDRRRKERKMKSLANTINEKALELEALDHDTEKLRERQNRLEEEIRRATEERQRERRDKVDCAVRPTVAVRQNFSFATSGDYEDVDVSEEAASPGLQVNSPRGDGNANQITAAKSIRPSLFSSGLISQKRDGRFSSGQITLPSLRKQNPDDDAVSFTRPASNLNRALPKLTLTPNKQSPDLKRLRRPSAILNLNSMLKTPTPQKIGFSAAQAKSGKPKTPIKNNSLRTEYTNETISPRKTDNSKEPHLVQKTPPKSVSQSTANEFPPESPALINQTNSPGTNQFSEGLKSPQMFGFGNMFHSEYDANDDSRGAADFNFFGPDQGKEGGKDDGKGDGADESFCFSFGGNVAEDNNVFGNFNFG